MKKSLTVVITDSLGLHARPASIVCAEAGKYSSAITAHYQDKTANVKSILNLLSLSVKYNDEITFQFDGDDADTAAQAVHDALLNNKLISE